MIGLKWRNSDNEQDSDQDICNTTPCPVWSVWSSCPVTCGTGVATRTRGTETEKQDCFVRFCPWSTWSQCTNSCGGGQATRTRGSSDFDTKYCNNHVCPTLAVWSTWTDCSVTCADGTQTRTRASDIENRSCSLAEYCPWTPWTNCSRSCGGGTAYRSRSPHGDDTKDCNTNTCETWSDWSECSAPCGTGSQIRERAGLSESKKCYVKPCTWTDWSDCSRTCGGGSSHRKRGDDADTKRCNTKSCANWTAWSDCSVTCGDGKKTRKLTEDPGTIFEIISDQQSKVCSKRTCPWADWTPCSVTCGRGLKERSRQGASKTYSRSCYEPACVVVTEAPRTKPTTTSTTKRTTPAPTFTLAPITEQVETNKLNRAFPDFSHGHLLIIGGRSVRNDKEGLYKVTAVSLDDRRETVIHTKNNWSSFTAPSSGFHRHCSVLINQRVFIIGGSWSRRDVYELTDTAITKLPLRLPLDMYLHSCSVMNNRIWACGPGRGQGKMCISLGW